MSNHLYLFIYFFCMTRCYHLPFISMTSSDRVSKMESLKNHQVFHNNILIWWKSSMESVSFFHLALFQSTAADSVQRSSLTCMLEAAPRSCSGNSGPWSSARAVFLWDGIEIRCESERDISVGCLWRVQWTSLSQNGSLFSNQQEMRQVVPTWS